MPRSTKRPAMLHLSPRHFSFSMARDTTNALMPCFGAARNEAERRQMGQSTSACATSPPPDNVKLFLRGC
jgi:hypothetical protein